jgi:hypothetical protein
MGNGEDNQWVLSGLSPSVGLHGKSFDLISLESGHLVGIIPLYAQWHRSKKNSILTM